MKLYCGCTTCIGNTRAVNQDAILLRSSIKGGHFFTVLAVCDGIGGLEKGEAASALVTQKINEWYDGVIQWMDIESMSPEVLNAHLKDAAEIWNGAVCEYRDLYRINTGTTMSLLMILRERFYIVQVGDSRVYRYRSNQLEQLTVDASIAKIKNGRMKSYLDNFMGKSRELWFTSAEGIVENGDLFLVCSDGLYHYLRREDISEIYGEIRDHKKANAACRKLTDQMMARGETDNISVGILAAEKKRKLLDIRQDVPMQRERPEKRRGVDLWLRR